MKSLSAIFFVLVSGALVTRAELPADWSTNYDVTLATAAWYALPT